MEFKKKKRKEKKERKGTDAFINFNRNRDSSRLADVKERCWKLAGRSTNRRLPN